MADPTLTNYGKGTTNTASATATFGFTATAGRLLVLVLSQGAYRTGVPSGWTEPTGGAQQTYIGFYTYYKIAAGGETSVTYDTSVAQSTAWMVFEFDNVDTATPYDTSAGSYLQDGGTNTLTTSSITPSSGRRLVIAAIGAQNGFNDISNTSGWTNSFTRVDESIVLRANNVSFGDCFMSGLAWRVMDGGSSVSTAATINLVSGSSNAAALAWTIASFKVVGGSSQAPRSMHQFRLRRAA
jgi:hypothetical protein